MDSPKPQDLSPAPAPSPDDSVLGSLERRTGSAIRVQLSTAADDKTPVVSLRSGDQASAPTSGDAELIGARYRIEGEIARGGIGVVYKAKDVDLGRDVAIKILHGRFTKHIDILQRFVEEAQIGGQLQHPGIVPVYEIGLCQDERPFIAMKLVKGETLAALLERRRNVHDDRHKLLTIFEQVCQTVAYAHVRRVVHRDLKPSN
ncbi:MAG: serine/threonine-protein kinase, partial [Planctomycetota bacterium]